jgi:hypothetical protein
LINLGEIVVETYLFCEVNYVSEETV